MTTGDSFSQALKAKLTFTLVVILCLLLCNLFKYGLEKNILYEKLQ